MIKLTKESTKGFVIKKNNNKKNLHDSSFHGKKKKVHS